MEISRAGIWIALLTLPGNMKLTWLLNWVNYIDGHYSTIKDRSGRAITGLSMGGHGALFLAFRHQDVFGACGSMSGGVDLRPFPDNWDIAKRLGRLSEFPDRWAAYSVVNMVDLLKPNSLAITFDLRQQRLFLPGEQKPAR